MNNKVNFNEQARVVLKNMPVGEPVTLIAFAKNKGIIYEAKKDFIIEKNKKIPVEFRVISQEELNKMFRNNVKAWPVKVLFPHHYHQKSETELNGNWN